MVECLSNSRVPGRLKRSLRQIIRRVRFSGAVIPLWVLVVIAGCAQPSVDWQGPGAPALLVTEGWNLGETPGRVIRTSHYNVYTTIEDEQILAVVPQVLEGALRQYRFLVPDVPLTNHPMECYLFANRTQWAAFTAAHAGEDAAVYLQVLRGGYTHGDRAVTYFLGDLSTYSVTAHEGWHQFVARHFKTRLPPFLEEGIASMFESVTFDRDLPRWNLSVNYHRIDKLRAALAGGHLWPLDELVRLHAGEVIALPVEQIEAFYAQNWAFARFLWDGEAGAHRPALRRWLADSANGNLPPGLAAGVSGRAWRPDAIAPLLEHYLEMPMDEIGRRYLDYVQFIATDGYRSQWN